MEPEVQEPQVSVEPEIDARTRLDDHEARPPGVMSPEEALATLHRGETLRDVVIRRLVLKGEFAQPVRMERVTLHDLNFDKVTFHDEVSLVNCTLDRPRTRRTATFAKGLFLTGSKIDSAVLRDLIIEGPLRLDKARLSGRVLFADSTIRGNLKGWELRSEGWLEFAGCTFQGDVDMRSMHLEEGFSFKQCTFAGDVLLRGTSVSKKLDFEGSRFEAMLDLSKAKLHDFTYLESIEQGPGARFAIANAVAERLLIRPDQIEGRLASECAGNFAQAMQEFGLLKRSYEALHRYDEEDWAFYRFKVNQRKCCKRSWRRPWTKLTEGCGWLFLDLGCGYGTKAGRAVVAALLIMAFFALIYMADVTKLNVERPPFGGEITTFGNRAMVGVLTSVSVFTSGFSGVRDVAVGWMNVPLIAESLLGTLLWGLFIVAFSRKVIR